MNEERTWENSIEEIRSMINVDLVQQVIRTIAEEPNRFCMSSYGHWSAHYGTGPGEDFGDAIDYHPPICKTTACFCGWVNIIEGQKRNRHPGSIDLGSEGMAKIYLGLVDADIRTQLLDPNNAGLILQIMGTHRGLNTLYHFCHRLFHIDYWPNEYEERWEESKTQRGKVAAAIAFLNYLLPPQHRVDPWQTSPISSESCASPSSQEEVTDTSVVDGLASTVPNAHQTPGNSSSDTTSGGAI